MSDYHPPPSRQADWDAQQHTVAQWVVFLSATRQDIENPRERIEDSVALVVQSHLAGTAQSVRKSFLLQNDGSIDWSNDAVWTDAGPDGEGRVVRTWAETGGWNLEQRCCRAFHL